MAAITSVALAAGTAAYQIYQGSEDKRKAQKAEQDYERQNLAESNPYEAVPISTVGSDIIREENQRTSANTVDALRNMGTRGAAMLPGVVAQNNIANQSARKYLDDQVIDRDYAIAADDVRTREMEEQRENADLAGIGQQIAVGRQDMWNGIRGFGSAAMYGMNNGAFNNTPQVESIDSQIKPAGLVPYSSPKPTSSVDWSKIYKTVF